MKKHLLTKTLAFGLSWLGLGVPWVTWAQPKRSTIAQDRSLPRLIVLVVVDQLRADQLLRQESQFVTHGFRKLMKEGAYAPLAEYPTLQNMTCPGHAMISTGASSQRNRVPLNEWFSREKPSELLPCAFDPQWGRSPKNLLGSTLGDQMRLSWPGSRVVSIALKDRSAIMLGGHSALAAYWFDSEKNQWTSSGYYPEVREGLAKGLPVPALNQELIFKPQHLKGVSFEHKFIWGQSQALSHPVAMEMTFELAKRVVTDYQMGQDTVPDLLLISLSNHDVAGHLFGPDSAESLEVTLREDRALAEFWQWLSKQVPSASQWWALTADHGVAPLVEYAQSLKIPAGRIEFKSQIQQWNNELRKKFGQCDEGGASWLLGMKSLNLFLNAVCWNRLSDAAQVQFDRWVSERLMSHESALAVVVCSGNGVSLSLGPDYVLPMAKASCVPGVSGHWILVPKPFWYEQGPPANHMTFYAYDRFVPLILWGSRFKAVRVAQSVSVLDLAGTLAYALGVIPPSSFEGRILHEMIRE